MVIQSYKALCCGHPHDGPQVLLLARNEVQLLVHLLPREHTEELFESSWERGVGERSGCKLDGRQAALGFQEHVSSMFVVFSGGLSSLRRCYLLMGLVACLGGAFILEQPAQSIMERHPRIRHLTRVINAARCNCVHSIE